MQPVCCTYWGPICRLVSSFRRCVVVNAGSVSYRTNSASAKMSNASGFWRACFLLLVSDNLPGKCEDESGRTIKGCQWMHLLTITAHSWCQWMHLLEEVQEPACCNNWHMNLSAWRKNYQRDRSICSRFSLSAKNWGKGNRKQRCERPIFTRSHLHTSPFQGFHGNTTSYLPFQSALFEPFASYASMEVVVGNCEQKLGFFRGFRTPNAFSTLVPASLPHSRQPKDLREMPGLIWCPNLCCIWSSQGFCYFLVKNQKKHRETKKKQKKQKNKDLREMSGLI